jgi:hypothetical protein
LNAGRQVRDGLVGSGGSVVRRSAVQLSSVDHVARWHTARESDALQ